MLAKLYRCSSQTYLLVFSVARISCRFFSWQRRGGNVEGACVTSVYLLGFCSFNDISLVSAIYPVVAVDMYDIKFLFGGGTPIPPFPHLLYETQ